MEPTLSCYLDDDWRFSEMAEYAVRCPGHNFADRHYGTYADVAVGLLGDLQTTLRHFWPNMPDGAVARFWLSWQVHNYIAKFFAEFAHSNQAKRFVMALPPEERYSVGQLRDEAISFAVRRVAEYIHVHVHVLPSVALSPSVVVRPIIASKWQDVTLIFIGGDRVRIEVQGGHREARTYREMGFIDQRTRRPTSAWLALVRLSEPGSKRLSVKAVRQSWRASSRITDLPRSETCARNSGRTEEGISNRIRSAPIQVLL